MRNLLLIAIVVLFVKGCVPSASKGVLGKGCWDEVLNGLWGLAPAKAFYWTI